MVYTARGGSFAGRRLLRLAAVAVAVARLPGRRDRIAQSPLSGVCEWPAWRAAGGTAVSGRAVVVSDTERRYRDTRARPAGL